ncbi:MAG: glycosyltransferase family 4 protein [Azonexus sp.]
MARILVTNFHQIGGGGHVPYIQALTKIPGISEHVIGIATPEKSRLHIYLGEVSYPYLYACDFPSKVQRELPSILFNIRKFRKIVSEFKPDIVHVNGGADMLIALWSHPLSRPYALVRTHHAIRNIPRDVYHRLIYDKYVSSNIYVSKTAMELSVENSLSPQSATIIENGVDLMHFRPITRDMVLAKKYGIDEDTLCFGSCAGTGPYKRVDTIIDAALHIKETVNGKHKFKIMVLGNTSQGIALQNLAKQKGLTEFVYCGFHRDVTRYVSLFDVGFILSDSVETISFAAREMLAMGKPLISSSFSGLKENVHDGVNGILVKPGDINELASAMKYFLDIDKSILAKFSFNAREYACNSFDINSQILSHSLLYDRVAAEFELHGRRREAD